MNLKTAKKQARLIGNVCRLYPNNVDTKHWELLSFLRGLILKKSIKK